MRRPLLIWAIVGARAASAHADAVVEEISAGASLSASTTPRLSWIADRLAGVWDASSRWQLRVAVDATRAEDRAGSESTIVFSPSASAELALGSHWSISVDAGGSPASTAYSSATILDDSLPGDEGEAVAQLVARSALLSLSASVDYDTAGASDSETTASLSFGANHFRSIQAITSIIDPDGQMLTAGQIGDHCATRECSRALLAALSPKETRLTQLSLGASVLHTMDDTADLGLGATCYIYDKDPTQVGYFSLATLGRGNLGTGAGVAPLRYTVTPTIGNRWGRLSGTLAVTYGIYFQDGYDVTASARVQYKLDLDRQTRMKLYGRLAGSRGVDPEGSITTAISAALGVQYSW